MLKKKNKHFSFRPIPIILIKSLTMCNCQRRGVCRGNRNKYPQVNNLNGESMFCPQGSSEFWGSCCVRAVESPAGLVDCLLCASLVCSESRGSGMGMADVLCVDTFLSFCFAKLYPRTGLISNKTLICNEWRKHLGAENFRNRERRCSWF